MAGISKLELAVDTGKWDAGLKKGKQSLDNFIKDQGGLQNAMAKSSDKLSEFVRILGRSETTNKTVTGRVNELKNAYTELRAQYNRLTAEEKRGDFGRALNKSLEQLRTRTIEAKIELNGISSEIQNVENSSKGFGISFSDIAGSIGLATTAMGAMNLALGAIRNNIQTAADFSKAMSQLSSLTGMTGDDLEDLKNEAIRLGSSTTQSASQVVDSFKLIGSQKPELLASKEALVAVTEAAITLAEAAGIEVPEASAALTGALNQFGMSGSEADRVINALAAGSQKGAGDINYLNTAISKCGAAANSSSVSFEQTVGAIEILAERMPDASSAGTNLRNILLTLTTQTNNEYNPAVVGLNTALENLKNANMSAAEMTKLFGKENYTAASILIDGAAKCNDMTVAVTDTDTAMSQAKINTNNFAGAVLGLESAWEGLNLTLNSSNGILMKLVQNLTSVVTSATNAISALDRLNSAQGWLDYIGSNLQTNGKLLGGFSGTAMQMAGAWMQSGSSDSNLLSNSLSGIFPGVRNAINRLTQTNTTQSSEATPKIKTPKTKTPKTKTPKKPKQKVEGTEEYWGNLFDFDKVTINNLKLGEDTIKSMMATLQQMPTTKTPFDYLTEGAGALTARIDEIKDKLKNGDLGFAEYQRLSEELKNLEAYDLRNAKQKVMVLGDNKSGLEKMIGSNGYQGAKAASEGLGQLASGLKGMGIELGEGFDKTISVMQSIFTVIEAMQTIISAVEIFTKVNDATQTAILSEIAFNTAMAAAGSFIPGLSNGGLLHAANGVFVPGASNGGRDTVRALLSPGELVLNAAQQSNLATQLQANAAERNDNLGVRVRGEDMYTALDNYIRRTGKRFSA